MKHLYKLLAGRARRLASEVTGHLAPDCIYSKSFAWTTTGDDRRDAAMGTAEPERIERPLPGGGFRSAVPGAAPGD